MGPAPVDFLAALDLKTAAADITIGGRRLSIPRARLGLHYHLEAIMADGASQPGETAGAYVAAATGLSLEEIDAGTAAELMAAFASLSRLNRFHGTLAVLWPRQPAGPDGQKPENYPHRALASVVARLSHAYGWTADHILEGLGPEEAMCYLQEAQVLAHEEAEERWLLAGGAVDKDGKPRPYPPIAWGTPPGEAPVRRPPRRLPPWAQPAGIVIQPDPPPTRRES